MLAVNEKRKRAMARKVSQALGGSLRGKTIAVLGLTFKPNTDDMRDAPSIPLVTGLIDMGAKVKAFDPVGMEPAKSELPRITYGEDAYSCAEGADAIVIVTEWVQFRALGLDRLKATMAQPVIVDRSPRRDAYGRIRLSVGRAVVASER
ncbi:UDP-glucose 6-dehydrogenase [Bradyrhizobium sp. LB12.1]